MNLLSLVFGGAIVAQNMFGGLPVDGIRCDSAEGAVEHIHANLQIFERGREVAIPASIGIPANAGCLYWVHTHSGDGDIHIESPLQRNFTLGEFFDVWGADLSRSRAAGARAPRGSVLHVTVNGKVWTGNPRAIPLRDHEEIVIQAGLPYGKPQATDWSRM